jgi:SM-20-related protein
MTGDWDANERVARTAAAIAAGGYAIVPWFLSPLAVAGLAARLLALDAAGAMQPARIGRLPDRSERPELRGDRICWLDASPEDEHEALLFAALESLRLALNEHLTLGLFDFEAHYAMYPPGAGYVRHCDVFRDSDDANGKRVLSCVLYLNVGWRTTDGGALRLYLGGTGHIDVPPEAGTFVAFLSDRFEHEVMPARRERLSVTGWFRRRVA